MHEKHELNRTLSLLGKQLLSLKSNYHQQHSQNEEKEINSSLAKIEERKKHVSKRKKKQKKTSIKSNLDIWDMRQEKTPELPSLNPLQKTIMARTKFNSTQCLKQIFHRKWLAKRSKSLTMKTKFNHSKTYSQSLQSLGPKCTLSEMQR